MVGELSLYIMFTVFDEACVLVQITRNIEYPNFEHKSLLLATLGQKCQDANRDLGRTKMI